VAGIPATPFYALSHHTPQIMMIRIVLNISLINSPPGCFLLSLAENPKIKKAL
jgi:hypothetical protein